MFDPFQFVFVQRGLLEVALLSVGAGLIGTWIVLRGLSFYSHAVGTAAFPGLVVADGLGFSASLGAFGAAAVFALGGGAPGPPPRRRCSRWRWRCWLAPGGASTAISPRWCWWEHSLSG